MDVVYSLWPARALLSLPHRRAWGLSLSYAKETVADPRKTHETSLPYCLCAQLNYQSSHLTLPALALVRVGEPDGDHRGGKEISHLASRSGGVMYPDRLENTGRVRGNTSLPVTGQEQRASQGQGFSRHCTMGDIEF